VSLRHLALSAASLRALAGEKLESCRLSGGRVVAHARLVLRGTPATSLRLDSFSSVGSAASPELDPLFKTLTFKHLRAPARMMPEFNGVHWDPYDTKLDGTALR
jgi:hypothetical protein